MGAVAVCWGSGRGVCLFNIEILESGPQFPILKFPVLSCRRL
jgi:hypothetical protein